MSTIMTYGFQKTLRPCPMDKSGLSIGRVKDVFRIFHKFTQYLKGVVIRFLITVFPSNMATGYKQNSQDVFFCEIGMNCQGCYMVE